MTLSRWAVRARHRWHHSTHPALATGHHLIDLARTPSPLVASAGGDGPTLAYGGLADGLVHVLPFLESRRTAPAQRLGDEPAGADLVALGCGEAQAFALPADRSLVLPMRVHLVVPLPADPGDVVRRVSRKDRQQHARGCDRFGWRLEEGTTVADFTEFYHRFHLPTMRVRHGERTRSAPVDEAYECLFRRGRLFFLTARGRRVAGMLCVVDQRGRRVVSRLAGVQDGAAEHYRSGVYMALHVLILQWAARQGLATADLSGCEPFLSKGIFQFKRKLHPTVTVPATHFGRKRLWLRVERDGPAVRDFLVANPPMVIDRRQRMRAVYFHDRSRPPRLDLRWQTPGLDDGVLVDLDEFLASGAPPMATTAPGRAEPSASD
ncbi:GNAT family N-acetyltransferase [Actinoplanes sp. NPDC048796]|uniref:GNAT family N-acetyltransferase n=1 Tax=unclassified Actinoplanes TaxID=2626549 RepID=UPI00340CA0D8